MRKPYNASKDDRKQAKEPSGARKQQRGIRSFQPDKALRVRLEEDPPTQEEILRAVELFLASGHKINLGSYNQGETYFLIIRQGEVDFQDAKCVSFWATSVERSLMLFWVFLTEIEPGWPNFAGAPEFENW